MTQPLPTPTAPDTTPTLPTTFEAQMQALEDLVNQLEAGEGDLDTALAGFQHGMALVAACKAHLAQADMKVEQVLAKLAATPTPVATAPMATLDLGDA